ncbi:DUF2976 domain-containing protein [Hahella ganghwensis]|uniref:DUF2976 domain-containing protein n=1 Tax=Hahella ganghwensis TaxID=286420 RepID=UPI00035F4A1B|nr:DUF2976 domain-containing protein [Hahella ganghwensis]
MNNLKNQLLSLKLFTATFSTATAVQKAGSHLLLRSWVAMAALFSVVSPVSLADLPDASDIVPDGIDSDDPIGFGTKLFFIGLQVLCVVIGAVATFGTGAHVYGAFSEARSQKDGWSEFAKVAAIGVFVVVIADALCILGYTYLSEFSPLS